MKLQIQRKNYGRCPKTTRKSPRAKFYNTQKHSQPFNPKYTHTLQSKYLITLHNTLLQEYKKSQTLAQSIFGQRTSWT